MERIGRPEDDFREKLQREDIDRICDEHNLKRPAEILPERRGNEKVCYHLDGQLFLAFVICEKIRDNVEGLLWGEQIDECPTPKLIAWSEEDPDLGVPYMIVERCPGERLDALWKKSDPEQRIQILEAFGAGTGKYHTVSASALIETARGLGLEHQAQHVQDPSNARERNWPESIEGLAARLESIGLEAGSVVDKLETYLVAPPPSKRLIANGLVHGEPCAEHFLMERDESGYRLSGCVDMGFNVNDASGEVASHYVSMLSIDRVYFDAFKRGYERFFEFPPDADEILHDEAISNDLDSILWLLNTMETRPEWSFAAPWAKGHLCRLEGWLDPNKRVTESWFRQDIGPW